MSDERVEQRSALRERCACGAEFEYALGSDIVANENVLSKFRCWQATHAVCMDVVRDSIRQRGRLLG